MKVDPGIVQDHITRIAAIVKQPGPERRAFCDFVSKLRGDINPSISESEVTEMLAQHLITRPVFDALFKTSTSNPVSHALDAVLDQLYVPPASDSLAKVYDEISRLADSVVTAQDRQALILKVYDGFFRSAFPLLTQRLGIVYTPLEIVDFILHSVNDLLISHFRKTFGSRGVHILDPFTGTGTFITRLLQLSSLIPLNALEYKYRNEIKANEIVLLAYYIAAMNIESVYQERMGGVYEPFVGLRLTDTFQTYEQKSDMLSPSLTDAADDDEAGSGGIRIIMGNPPYSVGQKNANDNAANESYPALDDRIRKTYAEHSKATRKAGLYDSYIRAFRWASDKLGDAGILAFISGSGWIEGSFADGMRKCLAEEFSDIYVFHLRGNVRKDMLSKKMAGEGDNVFGSGCMTGNAISLCVRGTASPSNGLVI